MKTSTGTVEVSSDRIIASTSFWKFPIRLLEFQRKLSAIFLLALLLPVFVIYQLDLSTQQLLAWLKFIGKLFALAIIVGCAIALVLSVIRYLLLRIQGADVTPSITNGEVRFEQITTVEFGSNATGLKKELHVVFIDDGDERVLRIDFLPGMRSQRDHVVELLSKYGVEVSEGRSQYNI